MAEPRDYYQVLGVSRNASADDIRRAYRRLARKYHPDVSDEPDAQKKFAEVQDAYQVLSDDEKRKAYDRFGHAGVGTGAPGAGAGAGAGGGRGGPNVHWYTSTGRGGPQGFEADDISSIFDEMFGGASGSPFGATGGRTTHARPRPQRGEDLHHTITVTFMTAAQGGTERLRLQSGETIDVKIPAGIDDGAKLRLRGRGRPGAHGGSTGDLLVTVRVGGHPYFRREGLNLLIDVPVNIAEAALGASVTVPLLKGTVDIKIPPGVSSGRKLRIKGRGITDSKANTGDFLAVVQIVGPQPLSDQGRKLVEQLASELTNPRETTPWAHDVKDK